MQQLITSLIFIMWQVVEMSDAVTQPVSSILDCRHPRFSFQPTTIVAASQITPQQQTHDNNGAVKPSARIEMSLKSFLPTGCKHTPLIYYIFTNSSLKVIRIFWNGMKSSYLSVSSFSACCPHPVKMKKLKILKIRLRH